ncbi:hypothetical protein ABVK25_003013 [Lepraria finkii]|uniref:GST N-terminal domain-containing protein n=1 Tax=Lepraria finkii TaxID=1340010 RepID=A0ABR4BFN5_9LECA
MSSTNLKPLTLHAHGTGPNPYKVATVLSALKPTRPSCESSVTAPNGVKGPHFLKINGNGRVPALEDNTSFVSWESGAVINYLLRVYDKSKSRVLEAQQASKILSTSTNGPSSCSTVLDP